MIQNEQADWGISPNNVIIRGIPEIKLSYFEREDHDQIFASSVYPKG